MNPIKTLCLSAFALSLVACGGGDKTQTDSGESQAPASTPPAKTETAPPTVSKVKVQVDLSKLPKTPGSFSSAKTTLYKKIYAGQHEKTFYCNCDFDPLARRVNLDSCGVTPRKNATRAERIEAEHVFPAYQFGNFRRCWREPKVVCPAEEGKRQMNGRSCCEDVDPVFETAHNDLHNLYPAVGEVNGDRSNYNWGMIAGEKRSYGQCNIEVDSSIRRAEPPETVQGDIARTMFYMSHTYGIRLSRQDIQLYSAWNKQDAVDDWERQRNGLIEAIQGNRNPFIDGQNYDPKKIARFGDISDADIAAAQAPAPEIAKKAAVDWSAFSCAEKKTCSKMTDCAEAIYQLNACDNSRLDGDGDGMPCTTLCKQQRPMRCDAEKNTCGEMKDCQEAQFYLHACGVKGLDRDGDGTPCASLCQ